MTAAALFLSFGATAASNYYINSVQEVSITIASGSTSNTATITSVGANAFIIWQGQATSETVTTDADSFMSRVTLTNTTTVTATRAASHSDSVTVNCVVVDPTANLVTGVQFGTTSITTTNTSATATITSVDTTLSAVFYLGSTCGTTGNGLGAALTGVTLTDATTVTASRQTATSETNTTSFCVVTFTSTAINNIQSTTITGAADTSTTKTTSITSAIPVNTFIAWGGFKSSAGTYNAHFRMDLQNSTTIRAIRVTGTSANYTLYCTVIELKAGIINSLQRSNFGIASATSATQTVTSVDTTKAFCNFLHSSCSASVNPDGAWTTLTQTNATTLTGARNTAGTNTTTPSYEVVEFQNAAPAFVNSVQQVSITITAGTSNTATITAVGANAFIIWQGFSSAGAGQDVNTSSPRIVLTNSTTVTATMNNAGTVTVNCLVVDPTSSLVTSVQAGTINVNAATSNTATITSVDTTLSAVFYLGQSAANATKPEFGAAVSGRLTLTNATTVTANINSTTLAADVVSYVVVTFAATAIKSLQQLSTTASAGTSSTQTITSVTTANTMLCWGGMTNTAATAFTGCPWITLTNATTVTLASNSTASFTCNYTVLEFSPGVLKSASQHGSIAISASTSGTATVTSVGTTKTAAAYLGDTGAGTTDATTNTSITQTNATTITANVNSSASPTVGYGVYEFN